jgi:hypothetical protein
MVDTCSNPHPPKRRKGPLQGRVLSERDGLPSVVGVGLLGVQGPGTRSAREKGNWRAIGGLAARSRRGVGARTDPARKSFDFNTSLCKATTHTLTTPRHGYQQYQAAHWQ